MAPTLRNRRATKEPIRLVSSNEKVRKKLSDQRKDPAVVVHRNKLSKEEGRRRQTSMWKLDEETQTLLNAPFVREPPSREFRFFPGMAVLSLSKGMYHKAEVYMYCGAALPATIFPAGSTRKNVPVEKWVATVLLHFDGWTNQYTEEIPENELISVLPTELCFVQAMLMAHEWNVLEREKAGLDVKAYSKSTWFLTEDEYSELEVKWQQLTGRRVSFGEFCGRIVATASENNASDTNPENNANGTNEAEDINDMDEAEEDDNDSVSGISSVSSAASSGNDENDDS